MSNTGTTYGRLATATPLRSIASIAGPIFATAGLSASVGLVDAYFIGLLGMRPLAAAGLAFPFLFLGTSLAMGFSNGVRTSVAEAVGSDTTGAVSGATRAGTILTVVFFGLVAVLAWTGVGGAARWVGVREELLSPFLLYLKPLSLGMVVLGMQVALGGALSGLGEAKATGALMLIAAVLNAILDPLLIFGKGPFPTLGIAGAAWATVLSWSASLVAAVYLLAKKGCFGKGNPRPWLSKVASVSVPFTVTAVIWPISLGVVTRWVSHYEESFIAAWGIILRVALVGRLGAVAIGAGMQVFIAQASGAKDHAAVVAGFAAGRRGNYWLGGAWFVLGALAALGVSFVAASHEPMWELIDTYLWIGPVGYGALGATIGVACGAAAVRSTGVTLTLYLLSGAILLLPCSHFGLELGGAKGLFWGLTVSAVLSDLFSWGLERRLLARARNAIRPSPTFV